MSFSKKGKDAAVAKKAKDAAAAKKAKDAAAAGAVVLLRFYTTPREMGGGALGGSLQRAWRYEAPMTPFLAARCGPDARVFTGR